MFAPLLQVFFFKINAGYSYTFGGVQQPRKTAYAGSQYNSALENQLFESVSAS